LLAGRPRAPKARCGAWCRQACRGLAQAHVAGPAKRDCAVLARLTPRRPGRVAGAASARRASPARAARSPEGGSTSTPICPPITRCERSSPSSTSSRVRSDRRPATRVANRRRPRARAARPSPWPMDRRAARARWMRSAFLGQPDLRPRATAIMETPPLRGRRRRRQARSSRVAQDPSRGSSTRSPTSSHACPPPVPMTVSRRCPTGAFRRPSTPARRHHGRRSRHRRRQPTVAPTRPSPTMPEQIEARTAALRPASCSSMLAPSVATPSIRPLPRATDQAKPPNARTDRGPHGGAPPSELLIEGGAPSHDAIDQATATSD